MDVARGDSTLKEILLLSLHIVFCVGRSCALGLQSCRQSAKKAAVWKNQLQRRVEAEGDCVNDRHRQDIQAVGADGIDMNIGAASHCKYQQATAVYLQDNPPLKSSGRYPGCRRPGKYSPTMAKLAAASSRLMGYMTSRVLQPELCSAFRQLRRTFARLADVQGCLGILLAAPSS